MLATPEPEQLLSLYRLSRKLDITYNRAVELRFRGVLNPDFVAEHIHLFRQSRIPEIQTAVREALRR